MPRPQPQRAPVHLDQGAVATEGRQAYPGDRRTRPGHAGEMDHQVTGRADGLSDQATALRSAGQCPSVRGFRGEAVPAGRCGREQPPAGADQRDSGSLRHVAVRVLAPGLLVGRRHADGEFCLGRPRSRPHQRQRVRAGDVRAAGDVDDAEHPSAVRVPDRDGRAGPRVHHRVVMLAGEDLDGTPDRQRGARRIGPCRRLRPLGAFDEVHPAGACQRASVSLDPQQDPGRVGDGEDMLIIAGALAEQLTKHRQCRSQRMPGPVIIQLVGVHPDGRQAAPILAGARGHAALPGAGDHGAHEGRHAVR